MTSLLLVGCGKMGSALLNGWLQHRDALHLSRIDIIEPNAPHALPGVLHHKSLDELGANYEPSIIIFAVKPQQLGEILPAYKKRFENAHPLYISIAAGKDLAFFAQHLGDHAHVVRAMPNTPALIGMGMTVLCSASTLPQSQRHIATQLMQSVGRVEWLDESQMDAVTALSGSGPAYLFYFIDALIRAGTSAGLSETIATTLAKQTILGSAALAEKSPESVEQLCKNVTSPGGTTEAALKILMQDHALEALIANAVHAAKKRSGELK